MNAIHDQRPQSISELTPQRRRANIRLAVILGLVAVGFFVAFILVNL